jgi:dienelactone hydrolase
LNKVIAWLKEQGVKEFGAVGFCFGGKFTALFVRVATVN